MAVPGTHLFRFLISVLLTGLFSPHTGAFPPSRYRPDLNTSFHWQLQGRLNMDIDATVYDIDLFDTSVTKIERLHDLKHRVICYFSAGSVESWRKDAGKFPPKAIGKKMAGWAGERWLDIRSPAVRMVMQSRLDLAVRKGCDGVEADNVDAYLGKTGFGISFADQLEYNRFLAGEAHRRGLAIALKNDSEQVEKLEPFFDFAINEQCHEYRECSLWDPFVKAGKAVFNVEYAAKYVKNVKNAREKLCRDARRRGFYTLILPRALDGRFRIVCKNR